MQEGEQQKSLEKIKIGIIGTGVGIRTHLKGFRLFQNDAEVYAISGSSLTRAKHFSKLYNIPIACSNYKELCNMDELDLVCIASPNKYHKEMLEYAISKHKNILCEKPMVNTAQEAKEIYETAKDYDRILVIDHQLRFNPYIVEIKKLIDNNTLGKIYNVRLNQQGTSFANENAPWTWSFDDKEFGGVRLAMASHFTDLIQYWFDSKNIVSVTATMNPVTKERLDSNGQPQIINASTTCNALIQLENELTIQYFINAGSYMGSRFDIEIFGDKGELTFSLDEKLKLYLRSAVGESNNINPGRVYPDEAKNEVSIFSGSFRYLAPQIIRSIQTNDSKYIVRAATPKDQVYCLEILDAIKESANNSTSVSFSRKTNEYF